MYTCYVFIMFYMFYKTMERQSIKIGKMQNKVEQTGINRRLNGGVCVYANLSPEVILKFGRYKTLFI